MKFYRNNKPYTDNDNDKFVIQLIGEQEVLDWEDGHTGNLPDNPDCWSNLYDYMYSEDIPWNEVGDYLYKNYNAELIVSDGDMVYKIVFNHDHDMVRFLMKFS